jgi:hypothetical protein
MNGDKETDCTCSLRSCSPGTSVGLAPLEAMRTAVFRVFGGDDADWFDGGGEQEMLIS